MRILALFCTGACVLLLAAGAEAKSSDARHKVTAHKMHRAQHARPKDPSAPYWNDPGRAAPPFSYRGDYR